MTNEAIKKRLSNLIDVRNSCVIGDAEHDENYKEDIKALQAAIEAIDMSAGTIEESKAEPSTSAPDSVNHPSHYETNGVECIVAMEAAQGADAVQDFCICNAFKYIWRHKHKNGAEDIKKAVWYLNKWLELERRYKTGNERF
jgi:trimethylamine:corrinoid methyltransferase-like protein